MPLRFTMNPFNGNLLVNSVGRVTVFQRDSFASTNISTVAFHDEPVQRQPTILVDLVGRVTVFQRDSFASTNISTVAFHDETVQQ